MRRRRSLLLTAALALVVPLSQPASAGDARFKSYGDAVPGHPGLTYLDLIRQVAPDLAVTDGKAQGHFAHDPRHVAGDTWEADPPKPVDVGFIEDQRIKVGGRSRIALLVDFGQDADRVQSSSLLMLFDDGPHPKLLDAADVGVDKETSFTDAGPKLAVGPGDDALIVYSGHGEADLSLDAYEVVATTGDHLGLVTLVRMVSLKFCGFKGVETAHFSTRPDPGRAYRQIDVAVRRVFANPADGDCGPGMIPKAGTHTFRATYRWNAAARRFETTSEELKTLEYRNERLFK